MPGEDGLCLEEESRREVMLAFPEAELHQPPPLAVSAMAEARRVAACLQARGEPLAGWLASEVRLRGICENAATLAVKQIPGHRQQVVQAYARAAPDRLTALTGVLATLT